MAENTTSTEARTDRGGATWGLFAALILLALILWIALQRTTAPAPQPQDANPTEFSGSRAREVLRALVGDGAPHPVGSAANARVRDEILSRLRELGLSPEVQSSFACGFAGCAQVENIVARVEGAEPGPAVALMAHYDSVPAGPGAGDDLSGVATILEIARALNAGSPPRRPVLLLITDGEEAGLLGARAFAQDNPLDEIGAILNLEARGTEGPSLLFETSGQAGWLVRGFAREAGRPLASSLFATIYDTLPNDTDLSVFKERDVPGLNFAFIGHPTYYHTARDDFENLSVASLQHQGDNALAALRAAAGTDPSLRPAGNRVFFDVLAAFVVHWPVAWTPILALVSLVLILGAAFLARRRGLLAWGSLGLGALELFAAVLLTAAAAIGFQMLLATFFPFPWVAQPLPAQLFFWLLALSLGLFVAGFFARRGSFAGLWAGVWLVWAILGLVLAFVAPGPSYLFVVPALISGLAGVVGLTASPVVRTLVAVAGVVAAGLLWIPILPFLYPGLGLAGLMVTAVLLGILLTSLAPLAVGSGPLGRRWLPLAAGVVAVICLAWAATRPPYSPTSPQPVSFQFHQDADTGEARWLVWNAPPFPQALRQAAQFGERPGPAFPWAGPRGVTFAAPAPPLEAPGPQLEVIESSPEGGGRRVRLRLTSLRNALRGGLIVPQSAKVESVRMNGSLVEGFRGGAQPWRTLTDLTLRPEGTEIELVLGSTEPFEAYVFDTSLGLPPSGKALAEARTEAMTPAHAGDVTTVSRKVRI